ncbi:hypothetical protein FisN_10Hh092 [Fistulifera solaris]|uniref:C2H2-type domain-containing protein n=1 Tax=Fistulifera solaris TaxID=1519565 RepID=A0A1Z5JXG6_FISSO|nr:hypothetical protein FisN_10Hh092 [Fistulifera solaris]|eukprot:GAX18694.1 hypothetical protein FisN_10Hh092 [Fistulifera solaris]
MPLKELHSPSELQQFMTANANCLVTFSAHWCGPCKASRPALEQAAASSPIPMAIVHEDALEGDLGAYRVNAFPTHIYYESGSEKDRIVGANIAAVQALVSSKKPALPETGGQRLGSGSSGGVSRLLAASPAKPAPVAEPVEVTAPDAEDDKMDIDEPADKPVDDPVSKLDPELLKTLTEEMGFSLLRAQKGLLYGNGSTVESAVEWLMQHQEDDDIDEPIPAGGLKAQSYKCNECGKILSNLANLELHANKTGHSDFEESTQSVVPLTAEEKANKIAEIKDLLKAKRQEREEIEKAEEVTRELQRRNMGKEMHKTREQLDAEQRKREIALRKKEKEDFKRERARIKAQLEKDKLERAANKGKLGSKLGIDGYTPDAIQYDVELEGVHGADDEEQKKKKLKASAAKIDDYIAKVSAYRAGGDGGKCLKVLKAYVGNLANNPNDPKFRSINMENNAYKTRVKPFVGAKNLLLAVGFSQEKDSEGIDHLVMNDEPNTSLLAETTAKLEKAIVAYG